jgi:hypothetical protein
MTSSSSRHSFRVVGSQVERQEPSQVKVGLGELAQLLVDAVERRSLWLRDLADEPVAISPDLYELLLAYREIRRSKAA